MKNSGKKALSILLTLCFILGLLPTFSVGAFAAGAATVTVGGVSLTYDATPVYATTDSSGTVTNVADGAAPTNNYIKLDNNGVLTMKNAYIAGALSIGSGDVTMKLIGANSVGGGIAIGSGTLTIQNEDSSKTGYLTAYGTTTAGISGTGTGTLMVSSGNVTAYGAAGISVGALTVSGGVLTAAGSTGDGADVTGATTISGGTVTLTGGTAVSTSYGLNGTGAIAISAGQVTAKGGKAGTTSAGINGRTVSVSGTAEVTAVGGDAPSTYGIAGAVTTADDTSKLVAVGGGAASTTTSYGILGGTTYNGGLLVTKGGYATTSMATSVAVAGSALTGAAVTSASSSLYYVVSPKTDDTATYTVCTSTQTDPTTLNNTIIINPNNVIGLSTETPTSYTLYFNTASSCTVTGFNVVLGGSRGSNVYGIFAGDSLSLSGPGSLVAVAGISNDVPSQAIYSGKVLTIDGANVTAIGGSRSDYDSHFLVNSVGAFSSYNTGELKNGGKLIGLGGYSDYSSYGIWGIATIDGGTTAIGIGGNIDSSGYQTAGIGAYFSSVSGSVTAIGGSGVKSYGLYQSTDSTPLLSTGTAIAGSGTEKEAVSAALKTSNSSNTFSTIVGGSQTGDFAVWAPTVAVTFDANGGKFADNSTTQEVLVSGGSVTLPTPTPTWGDYTFVGWYNNTQNPWALASNTKKDDLTESAAVHAKWKSGKIYVRERALDLTSNSVSYLNYYGTQITENPTTDNITAYNANATMQGEGWTWYANATDGYTAKTLVLSGAIINTTDPKAIIVPDGTTVILTEGTATTAASTSTAAGTCGIYSSGTVTIEGDGTLTATGGSAASGDSCGISAATVTVSGGTVNAVAGNAASGNSFGINATTSVSVTGGTVSATAGTASGTDSKSYGIYAPTISLAGGTIGATGYTSAMYAATALTGTGAGVKTLGDAAYNAALTDEGKAHIGSATNQFYTGESEDTTIALTAKVIFPAPVTFDSRDGTTAATGLTLPTTDPTWETYTFAGWWTGKDGTGTKVENDAGVIANAGGTLYAKWTKGSDTALKTVCTAGLNLTSITSSATQGATYDAAAQTYTCAAEGWTWYAAATTVDGTEYAANTLVLDGADIVVPDATALTVPDGTTIVVKSDSKVDYVGSDWRYDDYSAAGALTITGSGKLTTDQISGRGLALTLKDASLDCAYVGGNTVTIDGGTVKVAYTDYDGLEANNVYIKGGASVTVSGTTGNAMGAIAADTVLSVDAGTQSITFPSGGSVGSYTLKAGQESMTFQTILSGGNPATSVTISKKTETPVVVVPTVTIPATSNAGSANVTATVSGTTATIQPTATQIAAVASDTKDTGSVKIDLSSLEKTTSAVIPETFVTAAKNAENVTGLTVILPTGSVTLDKTALDSVGANKIKIAVDKVNESTLNDKQKEALGGQTNVTIVDVSVYVNDVLTHNFNDGKITVSVPYTLKDGENPDAITIWYLADDGTITPMSGKYNAETKTVDFTTDHLSNYVIASFPFTDVAEDSWYYSSVAYTYTNGLFEGTSDTTFAPEMSTTRGMIVTLLWRMEGKPSAKSASTFPDVESGAYYADAVAWAGENGVVLGYDNGNFGPDDTITREQMATILYRYAKLKGYDVSIGEETNILSYDDAESISEYAMPAMQWACGAGLLEGSENKLMPQDPAARAQVAAILERFSKNVVK